MQIPYIRSVLQVMPWFGVLWSLVESWSTKCVLCFKTGLSVQTFLCLSHQNEFDSSENGAVDGIHFHLNWFRTKIRFDTEVKGNSEIVNCKDLFAGSYA